MSLLSLSPEEVAELVPQMIAKLGLVPERVIYDLEAMKKQIIEGCVDGEALLLFEAKDFQDIGFKKGPSLRLASCLTPALAQFKNTAALLTDQIMKVLQDFPSRFNHEQEDMCKLVALDNSRAKLVFRDSSYPDTTINVHVDTHGASRVEFQSVAQIPGAKTVKLFIINKFNREHHLPKLVLGSGDDLVMEHELHLGKAVLTQAALAGICSWNIRMYLSHCAAAKTFCLEMHDMELPFATVEMIDRCCLQFYATEKETEELCVMCQTNFRLDDKLRRLPCFHIFHAGEIDKHLTESKECPVCKYPIDKVNADVDMGCTEA